MPPVILHIAHVNRLFMILALASVLIIVWAATHEPQSASNARAATTGVPEGNGEFQLSLDRLRANLERKRAAIRN